MSHNKLDDVMAAIKSSEPAKKKLTDDEIVSLYTDPVNPLSTIKIAAKDGRSVTAIRNRLKSKGVDLRSLHETSKRWASTVKFPVPPKADLEAKLVDGWSLNKIARHYADLENRTCSAVTVRRWLTEHGIVHENE